MTDVPLPNSSEARAERDTMFCRFLADATKGANRGVTRLQGLVPLKKAVPSDSHRENTEVTPGQVQENSGDSLVYSGKSAMSLPALLITSPVNAVLPRKPQSHLVTQEGGRLWNDIPAQWVFATLLCKVVSKLVPDNAAVTWGPDQPNGIRDREPLEALETLPDCAGREIYAVEGF